MMLYRAGRLAVLLSTMFLAVACASSGVNRSAQNLGQRLQVQLAPDAMAAGAVLERLPYGARITIPEQALFANGGTELDDNGRYVLASVIEGLLDPRILRIEVAEAPEAGVGLQGARERAVTEYFQDYGLGQTLEPAIPQQAIEPGSVSATPQGLTITVNVVSS
jgi:hypothetical protein